MTKTYRGVLLLALVGVLFVPAAPAAAAPAGVTKALDYLRAHQRTDGGFSYTGASGSAVTTPWATLAIAAGANSPGLWKSDGRSPVGFLQDTNLVTAATNSGNAAAYYALCILAYKAANRTDLLASAGSTQIDLVGKLESYQSLTDGFYAPGSGTALSTTTTAWAVLALVGAHESGPPVSEAVAWLQAAAASDGSGGGPNGDGGYGSQPLTTSDTTDTALAVQALVAAGVARQDQVVKDAAAFIEERQATESSSGSWAGGFVDTQGGYVNAFSTAMAIEGLNAAGVDPHGLAQSGHTPYTFLARLLQANGSYHEFPGDLGNVMGATMQVAVALSGHTLPVPHGPNKLTHFAPSFATSHVLPKAGARFAGRAVEITARYFDNAGGTGIAAHAVRVTVDGVNRTGHAHVTTSRLRLDLTKLTDGRHTWSVTAVDRAGNRATIERTFTVAVPVATGGGTHAGGGSTGGTGSGSSGTGSGSGTATHHTSTPTATPSATLSPSSGYTPTASPFPTGSTTPSASASVTGQVAGGGGGGSGGGNHAAIAVGTALAALVPLGFVGSWLVRRRLLGVLGGAARGQTLPQDASFWRSHQRASGPPPAGEE